MIIRRVKKNPMKYLVFLIAAVMLIGVPACSRNGNKAEINDASATGNTRNNDDSQGSTHDSQDGQDSLAEANVSAADSSAGEKTAVGQEINLLKVFKSLDKREDELGLANKYGSVSDVNFGSIDSGLVGNWLSSDGSESYSFSAEGNIKSRHSLFGTKIETQYTTFNIDGTNIIAYDAVSVSLSDQDGDDRTGTEIAYFAFNIVNDTLYMVNLESINEVYNSFVSTLHILYRADEGYEPAVKNPVELASLYGSWDAEGVNLVINEGGFTINGNQFNLSFDGRGKLILEKDGSSTAYSFSLAHQKNYYTSDRSIPSDQKYLLSLYYNGLSPEDRPNLADYFIDWKTEYGWETWYYTLNLSRPDTDN